MMHVHADAVFFSFSFHQISCACILCNVLMWVFVCVSV